jgi:ribonuclease HII
MPKVTSSELQERGLSKLQDPTLDFVIGVDEVGYGAWAGPVVVCAAVAPARWSHPEVRDSKDYGSDPKVARATREALTRNLLIPPIIPYHVILSYSSQEIDELGVARARDLLAMRAVRRCVGRFLSANTCVVMDGNTRPAGMPDRFICMPKADNLVPAVSAASILAKVYRDELMEVLALEYPGYDFENNVGYGTPSHQQGLVKHGVTLVHRKSYRNISQLIERSAK